MFEAVVEAEVGDADAGPHDQCADRGEIGDPEEDVGRAGGDVEVHEKAQKSGGADASVGDTKSFEAEEGRGAVVEGSCVENACGSVEEGVPC